MFHISVCIFPRLLFRLASSMVNFVATLSVFFKSSQYPHNLVSFAFLLFCFVLFPSVYVMLP